MLPHVVTIAYPRRTVPAELPEPGATRIIYTHTDFINRYRPATERESTTGSLLRDESAPVRRGRTRSPGFTRTPGQPPLAGQVFDAILDSSHRSSHPGSFLPYEQPAEAARESTRRIIEWTRSYFRRTMVRRRSTGSGGSSIALPLGEIDALGLPFESYRAALTDSMLAARLWCDAPMSVDLARLGRLPSDIPIIRRPKAWAAQRGRWVPLGPSRAFDRRPVLPGRTASRIPLAASARRHPTIMTLLTTLFFDATTRPADQRRDRAKRLPSAAAVRNRPIRTGTGRRRPSTRLAWWSARAVMGKDADGRPVGDFARRVRRGPSRRLAMTASTDPLALDPTHACIRATFWRR